MATKLELEASLAKVEAKLEVAEALFDTNMAIRGELLLLKHELETDNKYINESVVDRVDNLDKEEVPEHA